jgi:hypothetical protein
MAVDMGGGPSFMYAADAVAAYESFNSGRQQRPVTRTACRSTPDDAIWGRGKKSFRSSFDLHQRRNVLNGIHYYDRMIVEVPTDRFKASHDACRQKMMSKPPAVWEDISTAPYDRDLELAVIDGNRVHPLVFACRRTASGWVKVSTLERVPISPSHWRPWSAKS